MRVDKLIWAMRLCKTRSIGAEWCGKERVKLNGSKTKASKLVVAGDEIGIKVTPIWRTYRVLVVPKSRIGAKLISEHLQEITSAEDLETLADVNRSNVGNYSSGRPTKKDRRDIDKIRNDAP